MTPQPKPHEHVLPRLCIATPNIDSLHSHDLPRRSCTCLRVFPEGCIPLLDVELACGKRRQQVMLRSWEGETAAGAGRSGRTAEPKRDGVVVLHTCRSVHAASSSPSDFRQTRMNSMCWSPWWLSGWWLRCHARVFANIQ